MTLSGIPRRPPLGVLNPHLALRAVLSRFAGEGISSLLRQGEADVELAQLARRDGGRRAHHQVLRLLVHREQHDIVTSAICASELKNLAIDPCPPWPHACLRKRERKVQFAELASPACGLGAHHQTLAKYLMLGDFAPPPSNENRLWQKSIFSLLVPLVIGLFEAPNSLPAPASFAGL